MRKTYLIFFLFIIFLFSISYAQPPFQSVQTTSSSLSLDIIYPKFSYFKYGEDVNLHFHVHNSTGWLLTNDTTSCFIHIYNSTNHIIQNQLMWSVNNDVDFEYDISYKNLTQIGVYSYLVYCNSTYQAGYVSDAFEVNNLGTERQDYGASYFALIILPVILSLILLYISNKLGDDHIVLKIFIAIFSPIGFIISLWLSMIVVINVYLFTILENAIGVVMNVVGFIYFAYICYWLLYIFIKLVARAAQNDNEKMEY